MPAPNELKSIVDALADEADRTVAIVGASLVESSLQTLLTLSFKVKDGGLLPRLFENRGPLSDFNSKILITQAFGLMREPACEEFQRIRHIRNAFAHARLPISFDTPEVEREIRSFIGLAAMANALKEAEEERRELTANIPPKRAFLLMVNICLIILDGAIEKRGGSRLLGD